MKKVSKVLSVLLALAMILGLAVTAFAAETTGTITIEKAKAGQTYHVYQMFDAVAAGATVGEDTPVVYTIKTDSKWYNFVKDGGAGAVYVTLTEVPDSTNQYYVTANGLNDTTAAEFAKLALAYATANSIAATQEKTPTADGDVTFDGLDFGYYLVDSSLGALCGLNTTNAVQRIEEKNAAPTMTKEVEEDSKIGTDEEYGETNDAGIGETVNFKLTITAQPGAENYVVHDKMDSGLTFDPASVKVDGEAEGDKSVFEVKTTGIPEGETFEIVFTKAYLDGITAQKDIVITYSATVNANAVIGEAGNKNTAHLAYGDAPNATTEVSTTTKVFSFNIFKYADTDTPLSGAKFTLSLGGETLKFTAIEGVAGKEKNYRLDPDGTVAEFVTPESGRIYFEGLDEGVYTLTETEAPAGYNKLEAPIEVTIDHDGKVMMPDENNGGELASVDEVKILNRKGSLLPSTGGIGTTIFYIAGAVLVLAAGVALILKRRLSAAK